MSHLFGNLELDGFQPGEWKYRLGAVGPTAPPALLGIAQSREDAEGQEPLHNTLVEIVANAARQLCARLKPIQSCVCVRGVCGCV